MPYKDAAKAKESNHRGYARQRKKFRSAIIVLHSNKKKVVLTHYGKNGALRCSWPGCDVSDIDMLTLDHINDDRATDRFATGTYSKLIVNDFPSGYQTLCFNHNWKKELMRRRALRARTLSECA